MIHAVVVHTHWLCHLGAIKFWIKWSILCKLVWSLLADPQRWPLHTAHNSSTHQTRFIHSQCLFSLLLLLIVFFVPFRATNKVQKSKKNLFGSFNFETAVRSRWTVRSNQKKWNCGCYLCKDFLFLFHPISIYSAPYRTAFVICCSVAKISFWYQTHGSESRGAMKTIGLGGDGCLVKHAHHIVPRFPLSLHICYNLKPNVFSTICAVCRFLFSNLFLFLFLQLPLMCICWCAYGFSSQATTQ